MTYISKRCYFKLKKKKKGVGKMKYRREVGVKFNHKGRARLSQDLGKERSKIIAEPLLVFVLLLSWG